jgi:PAS domain S-box-containing protein
MALPPEEQKELPFNPSVPEEAPAAPDPNRRDFHENDDWCRDLVEHSQDLLCVHDLNGRFLSVNPMPARLLGYSVEEMLRKPMRDFIAPQFREQFDAYLREIERSGESHGLLSVVTRSGEQRIWEYHNTLRTEGVDAPIVRGMAHDVTERVRAEKALRATCEEVKETARQQQKLLHDLTLFRTLLDHSNDAIEVVDPETLRLLDVNERECVDLGYCREELLTMTVYDIDPRVDESMLARLLPELRASGFVMMESVHRRKDGTTFPVEVNIRRVLLEREYLLAVARDITVRKQAEEAHRESELRFRTVYERSPMGIALVEMRTGKFVQANPKFCEIVGRSQKELLQIDVRGITHPDDITRTDQYLRQTAEDQQPGYEIEKRYIRPDGSVRWVNVLAVAMPSQGEARRWQMGLVQDITERKQAEEAVARLVEEVSEAKRKLAEEKLYLEQEIDTELGFGEIIGQSKALQSVMESVAKVAASDAAVLLLGETGTGKELVARAVHRLSQRANNSFIKLNCAAIPSGLLESELFGNEKGAFTGAVGRKIGRLELADKGTLFLDEIGEISLSLQPKLLRVLQDQEFERLGGIETLKVNFRLIAATNRNLADSVRENEFRSDLYYRLNVFPVRVPPLRERPEDIQLLVEHFVHRFARKMKKSITSIPTKTMQALKSWEWPGNIRELENFIERSVILTQGSVLVSPLSELRSMTTGEKVVNESLEAAEREHILRALRESHGQIGGTKGAAIRLGLKRTTLQSKLRHLGINPRPGPTQH